MIPEAPPLELIKDEVAGIAGHVITILLIDDDPENRENLGTLLHAEGYSVVLAIDSLQALEMVERENLRPDLIMTDQRLPDDRNGPAYIKRLREWLSYDVPVITLTGKVSTETFIGVDLSNSLRLTKPVKLRELTQAVQRAFSASRSVSPVASRTQVTVEAKLDGCLVFVVDDNEQIGEDMRTVIEADGGLVDVYATSEAFMASYRPGAKTCLLVDAYLPGMNGIDLLRQLRQGGDAMPAIMITGNSDVAMAVAAMKAGASDFIEKPVSSVELLSSIQRAIDSSLDHGRLAARQETASMHMNGLTVRQRQIMAMVLAGEPSKNIAADLGISQRTVENHRASIMRKTGAKSLPALARLAVAAEWNGANGSIVAAAIP
jgi:two-component system CheB/CheR fusion protein